MADHELHMMNETLTSIWFDCWYKGLASS